MISLRFAAFFVFIISASGAPSIQKDACQNVRTASLDLNHYARTASVKARNGSTDVVRFSSSLGWIDVNDKCDPGSLKEKPTPCIKKLLSVLTSYDSAVERISAFGSCSKITTTVKPAIKKLHRDMTKCLRSLGGEEDHVRKEEPQTDEHWLEDLMCIYTLDRLFSFSIINARVFAAGDPTHHSRGPAQKCPFRP